MSIRFLLITALALSMMALSCKTSSAQRGDRNWNQFTRYLGGGFSAGYHWRNPGPKVNYYNPYSHQNTSLVTGALPQGASCYLSQMDPPAAGIIEQRIDIEPFVGMSQRSAVPRIAPGSEAAPPAPAPRFSLAQETADDPVSEEPSRAQSSPSLAIDREDESVVTHRFPLANSMPFVPTNQSVPAVEAAPAREAPSTSQPSSAEEWRSSVPTMPTTTVNGPSDDLTRHSEGVNARPTLWPGLYDHQSSKVSTIPYPVQHRKLRRSRLGHSSRLP